MPQFLFPRKATRHRVAAIALYRALLSRCTSIPLADENQKELSNVVRQKFRKNRKLQSPYQIGLAFRAGYETLDHLDAASAGSEKSTSFIQKLLESLPPGIKRPPPIRRPATPKPTSPPKKPVLDVRPYAQLSGPRHIPKLASANGIPFLRLTKPQPPTLTRVILQKMKRNNQRFDDRVLLGNYYMPQAEQEDEWDAILLRNLGVSKDEAGADHIQWVNAVAHATRKNLKEFNRNTSNTLRLRDRMIEIIDKETELAKAEGQEVVRGKKSKQSTKRVAR
ncbi:hypothetical protein BU24DRAFT_489138 [Aaosphaeria arxii CBS 175.79]|uniref:Complex 1 LYR protein domain-containing protein n=1 Tax=Aaosphaeria arxii CBS 175.79 TaxID=1450172 RepID=A0A6A5Y0P8_9PLEO|nr:uncharacterized protein BU24DRAFT_489138 [Aaosphaeria arxii CBS 175.79]KAF2019108.1 hypothetical protein BU24DRAFT_489138 [Aaosphaeria arxii CBS 175.79]